jgi:hypothetical protein
VPEHRLVRVLSLLLLLLASAAAAVAPARAEDGASAYERRRWGPSFLVGIPHPFSLSVDLRIDGEWSVGLALGGLAVSPRRAKGSTRMSIGGLDLRGRWHPWRGAFFLGAMLGGQTLSGSTTNVYDVSGQDVSATITLDVKSAYFTPHLGWMWIKESGFTIGVELGWQVPSNPRSLFGVSVDDPALAAYLDQVKATQEYKDFVKDIEDRTRPLGLLSFPYVTVLRVGWVF